MDDFNDLREAVRLGQATLAGTFNPGVASPGYGLSITPMLVSLLKAYDDLRANPVPPQCFKSGACAAYELVVADRDLCQSFLRLAYEECRVVGEAKNRLREDIQAYQLAIKWADLYVKKVAQVYKYAREKGFVLIASEINACASEYMNARAKVAEIRDESYEPAPLPEIDGKALAGGEASE